MVGSSSGVETSRISPQASSGRRTRPERLIGCWQKWAYSTCLHQRPVFAGPFDELGSELVGELVTKDGVGRAPLAPPPRAGAICSANGAPDQPGRARRGLLRPLPAFDSQPRPLRRGLR